MQVATNENFQQLVETGRVPEFKAPEAAKPAAAADAKLSPTVDTSTGEQPRGADGKFTKAEDADKSTSAAGAKPAESDDDEGGDDLPEHARKVIGKKHRLQKEAEEFGRTQYLERRAAETRAEKAEQQLRELEAKSRPATPKATEPKAADFATVEEYSRALAKYWAAEEIQAERSKAEEQRQADEKAERERAFGQKIAAAQEKYPDLEERLKKIAGTDIERVHNDVIEYMQESEFGGDILYHLLTHPETLERFRKLSPRLCIAQLGKLETKWEKSAAGAEVTTLSQAAAAATTTTTPAVSKAPAPIAPLASDKATVVHKDPSQMSFQELRAYERQREAEKRAARR